MSINFLGGQRQRIEEAQRVYIGNGFRPFFPEQTSNDVADAVEVLAQ